MRAANRRVPTDTSTSGGVVATSLTANKRLYRDDTHGAGYNGQAGCMQSGSSGGFHKRFMSVCYTVQCILRGRAWRSSPQGDHACTSDMHCVFLSFCRPCSGVDAMHARVIPCNQSQSDHEGGCMHHTPRAEFCGCSANPACRVTPMLSSGLYRSETFFLIPSNLSAIVADTPQTVNTEGT